MDIKLNEARLKAIKEEVQTYFRNEHDETIGTLKAEMLIEFFIKRLGPQIYNQAIDDANTFIHDKLIDLDATLFVPDE
jgi:uncharacterized protein (DUF2164 family)